MFKIFFVIFEGKSFWNSQKAGKLAFWLTCSSLLLLLGCGGESESTGLVSTDPGPGGSVGTGSGKATLSWDAPTTNADGTTLTDLAGYKVYYGTTSPISKENSQSVIINDKDASTYTLTGLNQETYYFAVTAYDTSSNESGLSDEVSKVVSGI